MPYLPMNYFPKNCGIAINNNTDPVALQCTVDSYDIINRAIIRIYGYVSKELEYIIYLDSNGKIVRKDSEMNDEDYIAWCNGELVFDDPDSEEGYIDYFDYENEFPIYGGQDEKSIIYVLLQPLDINLSLKKYLWDIEVFNEDFNVLVIEGEFETDTEVTSSDNKYKIKIYPNNDIQVNNLFRVEFTDLNDYIIKGIENYDFSAEANVTVSKSTEQKDDLYLHNVTIKDTLSLPDNMNDMRVNFDIYTYSVTSNQNNLKSDSDVDGVIYFQSNQSAVIYSKILITEEDITNGFIYIYRYKQTLYLDKAGTFSKGSSYTIYANSIKSTPNYFIGIVEPGLLINTLSEDYNNISSISNIATLKNSFHQFWGQTNGKVKWYQWTLFEKNQLIYKTDRIYSSNIYFEYGKFFNDSYELSLKVQYQDGYEKETNVSLLINHESPSNLRLNLDLDNKNRSILIKYTNIEGFSPVTQGDWSFNDYGVYSIDGSLTYTIIDEQNLGFGDWSLKGKFGKDFCNEIFSFKNNFKTISLKYNPINDNFEWISNNDIIPATNYVWYINNEEKLFINSELNSNNRTTLPNPESEDAIVGFYYNDFLYNKEFEIQYTASDSTIKCIINNNEFKLNNITNFNEKILELKLFGNINWNYIKINSSNDTENVKFHIDYTKGKMNADDIIIPDSFALNRYDIYRNNLSQENNVISSNFVASINITQDNDSNLTGIYDYGVGGDNSYSYYLIPIYSKTNESNKEVYLISGPVIYSNEVKTDWWGIALFGVKKVDNNKYLLDDNQKWYFDLDVDADNLNFNTEQQIYSVNSELPKIGKSNKSYLSSSIKAKLGSIKNECLYVNDNMEFLHKFFKFSNTNDIKILRLYNGLTIPVSIQLKSSNTQNNLMGTPTDISFDWVQIDKYEDASIYDYFYIGEDDV